MVLDLFYFKCIFLQPIARQPSDSAAALAHSFSELSSAALGSNSRTRFYWEVDMEEVEMGPKIGQGAFGGTGNAIS